MTSVLPNDDTRRGPDSGASKVRDAAEQIRAYLANQWKPIRLNGDTKRPVDEKWPDRWVSEEDLLISAQTPKPRILAALCNRE
jgi:hypothetical protein